MIYKFGPCETGKAHGRPMSPQSAGMLEKAHPGSVCKVKTRDGREAAYRREGAKALDKSIGHQKTKELSQLLQAKA